jgi:hypothetical protein
VSEWERRRRNALGRTRYGRDHKALRQRFAAEDETGLARCAICGELLEADAPWDLAHDDADPSGRLYAGPAHPRCHRGEPHRNKTSREW